MKSLRINYTATGSIRKVQVGVYNHGLAGPDDLTFRNGGRDSTISGFGPGRIQGVEVLVDALQAATGAVDPMPFNDPDELEADFYSNRATGLKS